MKTRVFLALLGVVLLLWGAGMPLVLWLGAETQGRITHVRRQLGDRAEAIPNRYAYTIAYEFRLPGGQTAEGHTQRVGDYFSPQDMAVGKAVRVHYLPGLPWVSVIPSNGTAYLEYGIVGAVGAGLLVLALRCSPLRNTKQRRGRRSPDPRPH